MKKKLTYTEKKDIARQKAIDWQIGFADKNYSIDELAFFTQHFTRLGKRYGLLNEFRANGIC